MEVNQWIYLNHISPKGTKRKECPAHVFFLWILQNFQEQIFLRTPPVAVSEDEHDENKLQHITFRLKMLSLNDSLEGRIA